MSEILFTEAPNPLLYSDVDPKLREIYQKNELEWYREDNKVTQEWSHPSSDPSLFIPVGINEQFAMGFMTECAPDYKLFLGVRERHAFGAYWKQKLMRCKHRKQYDYLYEEFEAVVKHDPHTFTVVEKALQEDAELQEFSAALPEERPEGEEKGYHKEPAERTMANCIMKIGHFSDPPSFAAETTTVRLVLLDYSHSKQNKRCWKIWDTFKCQKGTFPAGFQHPKLALHLTAHYVADGIICVTIHHHNDRHTTEKWFVQGHPKRALTCCMSPNGKRIAVCDELNVYTWSTDEHEDLRVFHLESEDVLVHACALSDEQLCLGTTLGQVYQIHWETR